MPTKEQTHTQVFYLRVRCPFTIRDDDSVRNLPAPPVTNLSTFQPS